MPFNRAVRSGAVGLALAFVMGVGVFGQEPRMPPGQNPPPATALIVGQVIDVGSGKPVPGVAVQLNRVAGPPGPGNVAQSPVITDSQGRFYFGRLRAGSYAFITSRPGYSVLSPQAVMRFVEVADGERVTDVRVAVVKLAAISGTLRDDGGDPVPGVNMVAFRRSVVNGRAVMQSAATARSDDRGVYRLNNLQPGSYVVCACGREAIPFDGTLLTTLAAEPVNLLAMAGRAARSGADTVQFEQPLTTSAPTLYPSSATVARADRIAVTSGEERTGIDLTLPSVRGVRVSGIVTGADGVVTSNAISLIAAGESDEGALLTRVFPTLVQPDGRFDFANVPPGAYTLRVNFVGGGARASSPTGAAMAFLGSRGAPPPPPPPPPPAPGQPPAQIQNPVLWAAIPVVVADRDVTGLSVAVRPGGSLNGRVRVEDDKPLPSAQVLQRAITLVSMLNPPPGTNSGAFGNRINPDGTFRVPFLVSGRYQVSATNVQGLPTLKSVDVDGTDMTDLPIAIDSDVTDVVITMSADLPATVSGTVLASDLANGYVALVFPVDRRLWADPDAASRRYRATAVSRSGAFSIPSLPAGDYYVAAVPDPQSLDWQEASRLEALSRQAVKITLTPGAKATVEVRR